MKWKIKNDYQKRNQDKLLVILINKNRKVNNIQNNKKGIM